ncbi:MAG: hypothetical protein C4586_04245 [Anaerolineaceae bacterium]|nr:MAG: hypothetical protein C4586_04245 [Anaerolineaceae bacterium]
MIGENKKMPKYTLIGGRITLVLLLVLGVMILRNCVNSYIYGTNTEPEELGRYYDLGREHGAQAARGVSVRQPEITHSLLRKTYQRGYRDGWDGAHRKENTLSEHPGSSGKEL